MNLTGYFYVDASCETGLRWNYEGGKGRSKHYVGGSAGYKRKDAYIVSIGSKRFKVHRIIYEIHHNRVIQDKWVIDHIDGNPHNNNINNLREVPKKINTRNMKKNINNTSGFTGVSIDQKTPRLCYAVAQWRDENSIHKSKSFSYLRFGEELAIFLATEYRRHQIDLLNIRGFGYTPSHGETREVIEE